MGSEAIGWAHLILTALCSLVSGLFGGWAYAHKAGRRQQKLEDDIIYLQQAQIEIKQRLVEGDKRFDALVRLERAAQDLTGELQATQRIVGELVTRRECAAHHQALDKLCNERHRRPADGSV